MENEDECYCRNVPKARLPKPGEYHLPDPDVSGLYMEDAIKYLHDAGLDDRILDCNCHYIDRYADLAYGKMDDEDVDLFFKEIEDLWWHNLNYEPIAPETTLDAVQEVLKKNLHIAELLFAKYPEDRSRFEKVEIIDAFFHLAHDYDSSMIVYPCFTKNDQKYDREIGWMLKEINMAVLDCLFEGKW